MTDAIFDCLRMLVRPTLGESAALISDQKSLVPIEQTIDGWFCLTCGGEVVHVDAAGGQAEIIYSKILAVAMLGSLARRFPLATWFLPRADRAMPCPRCKGYGTVPNLSEKLRERVLCQCGGIGWIPVE
jgi:hypothetical protein